MRPPQIKKIGMKVINAGAKVIKWHQASHARKQNNLNKYGRKSIGS